METGAMVWKTDNDIQENIEKEDIQAVDKILTVQTLGIKAKSGESQLPSPAHILDCIREVDKFVKGHEEVYGNLSDFAHPNYSGALGTFGKINKATSRMEFDFNNSLNVNLFAQIRAGIASLEAIEFSLNKILGLKEKLLELERRKPLDKIIFGQ